MVFLYAKYFHENMFWFTHTHIQKKNIRIGEEKKQLKLSTMLCVLLLFVSCIWNALLPCIHLNVAYFHKYFPCPLGQMWACVWMRRFLSLSFSRLFAFAFQFRSPQHRIGTVCISPFSLSLTHTQSQMRHLFTMVLHIHNWQIIYAQYRTFLFIYLSVIIAILCITLLLRMYACCCRSRLCMLLFSAAYMCLSLFGLNSVVPLVAIFWDFCACWGN